MKSTSLTRDEAGLPPLPVSRQILALVGWIALSFAAAAIGGLASAGAGPFYEELARPAWAPPAWVFAPVWTVLYLLMGVAAWLVWKAGGFLRSGGALPMFVVQLAMNALWTWLFFVWHSGAWSFTEIMLLWALVAATTVLFWRVSSPAGLLLLPYLLWLTYASALCQVLWKMNPDLLG